MGLSIGLGLVETDICSQEDNFRVTLKGEMDTAEFHENRAREEALHPLLGRSLFL